MPTALNIIPQFAFIRAIFLMNQRCTVDYACYGPPSTLYIEDEFSQCLIWLYADALIFFLFFLYLDQ